MALKIRTRLTESVQKPGITFKTPSRTKQAMANEVNINKIMERYRKTGVLPSPSGRKPMFMDVSKVPDLQTTLKLYQEAEEQFLALPAATRKRFGNDPQNLLDYLDNLTPEQADEAYSLGLIEKPITKADDVPPKQDTSSAV